MALNVGTVTVRRRLPSLRDVSMGPLAAFAVRCRWVVFDGLVELVALLVWEGFEAADVVWDFAVDLPPRAGAAVFFAVLFAAVFAVLFAVLFAAVEELRLREVAGVVTGLTSAR
ncbi:hypothetical protein VT50_0225675 [Streptomyces antioxidans]|uniref:Uncharacterized protein n=1 Tax=Streptomyces antioxidans TaxID=1507734 RepID=A0A1V4D077_9ACTN|nr:hypothetical protein VT50_0225675 [Streptomyces antioxidans]